MPGVLSTLDTKVYITISSELPGGGKTTLATILRLLFTQFGFSFDSVAIVESDTNPGKQFTATVLQNASDPDIRIIIGCKCAPTTDGRAVLTKLSDNVAKKGFATWMFFINKVEPTTAIDRIVKRRCGNMDVKNPGNALHGSIEHITTVVSKFTKARHLGTALQGWHDVDGNLNPVDVVRQVVSAVFDTPFDDTVICASVSMCLDAEEARRVAFNTLEHKFPDTKSRNTNRTQQKTSKQHQRVNQRGNQRGKQQEQQLPDVVVIPTTADETTNYEGRYLLFAFVGDGKKGGDWKSLDALTAGDAIVYLAYKKRSDANFHITVLFLGRVVHVSGKQYTDLPSFVDVELTEKYATPCMGLSFTTVKVFDPDNGTVIPAQPTTGIPFHITLSAVGFAPATSGLILKSLFQNKA